MSIEKTHKVKGNRKVTHRAWSITQCPCFPAERTVCWFLTGKKYWNIVIAKEFSNNW